MKVWITRDWGDRTYEVWTKKPKKWNDDCYDDNFGDKNALFTHSISTKEAKKMFNLPRHLKKKEIAEGTMTFKVKVK